MKAQESRSRDGVRDQRIGLVRKFGGGEMTVDTGAGGGQR